MILGEFDDQGRSYVECRVAVQRFRIDSKVRFLLDTGASNTLLHPQDSYKLGVPFASLANRVGSISIGGVGHYFREPGALVFEDGFQIRMYGFELLISEPSHADKELPSLLGRNIINYWRVEYDPSNNVLECTVRHADYTLDIR